jgi:hypothetical protein
MRDEIRGRRQSRSGFNPEAQRKNGDRLKAIGYRIFVGTPIANSLQPFLLRVLRVLRGSKNSTHQADVVA